MTPLIPRVHLFEIDDQPWFPSFLRVLVQNTLSELWELTPPFQDRSAARVVASILVRELGEPLSSCAFVDCCAGGGGPTASIERAVNAHLYAHDQQPVDFILTDLRPNLVAWDRIIRDDARITYDSGSVDAANLPERLTTLQDNKQTMRTFHLSFHHFDDLTARQILRDCVDTGQGIVITEILDRSVISIATSVLVGFAMFLFAPFFAWKWRSLNALIFTYMIPILPFVMAFDGVVSALRMRSPEEIEVLLRRCGGNSQNWEVLSGRDLAVWPIHYVNWVICRPAEKK